MSPVWKRPNLRNPKEPQIEYCDLCGSQVSAQRLIQAEVQGLRGARICDLHPAERLHRINPSFDDMGGLSNVAIPAQPDLLPHAGTDWSGGSWSADGETDTPHNYLSLLGPTGLVTRPYHASLDEGPLTIELWATAAASLLGSFYIETSQTGGWSIRLYKTRLYFTTFDAAEGTPYTSVSPATPMIDPVWTHFAVVYRPNDTVLMYVDGAAVTVGPVGQKHGLISGSKPTLTIYPAALDPKICELRIWSSVRTAAQIAAYYNRTISKPPDDLILRWAMDGSTKEVIDTGGYEIDGLATGTYAWGFI